MTKKKGCPHKKTFYSGEQRTAWKNGERIVFVDEHCDDCEKFIKRHVRRKETK